MMGDPGAREAAAVGWIVLGQDRKVGLRVSATPPSGPFAGPSRRPIPPQAPEGRERRPNFFCTGSQPELAWPRPLSTRARPQPLARTRQTTKLRWSTRLLMEPTEEDDADDVDHEVDESSKSCDDEDPDAPEPVDDAGEEAQLTRPS